MEFLHPAMWHVALESWQWIYQVAAPYNVIRGSGMTCHWIRPNVRHIGILHLVWISTTSPQSTCHSAPVSEILSKSDHPRQKKMTSCRFSRWRISTILDFRGPIMGSLKSPGTTSYRSSIDTVDLNCLVFEKIAFLDVGKKIQDGGSPCVTDRVHVHNSLTSRHPSTKLGHVDVEDTPYCPILIFNDASIIYIHLYSLRKSSIEIQR